MASTGEHSPAIFTGFLQLTRFVKNANPAARKKTHKGTEAKSSAGSWGFTAERIPGITSFDTTAAERIPRGIPAAAFQRDCSHTVFYS